MFSLFDHHKLISMMTVYKKYFDVYPLMYIILELFQHSKNALF